MKTIDLLRWALRMTGDGTVALVEDMRDASLTQPTPGKGGNHSLWCVGHQAYLEAGLPRILLGPPRENPLAHWAPMFATGTLPTTDPGAYPPFTEVLRTYRDVRTRTLALLDEIGESGLEQRPAAIPTGFEDAMRTCGQTILLMALHNMVHYGQIADARRAAGKKPLM